METVFEIKAYTPAELGLCYFPLDVNGRNAWRKLKKWIEAKEGLLKKLEDLGYGKSKQPLTPLMVRLIVEAFGEP